MIKRTSPYGGILHEVVVHNGTLYFGGMVSDDLSLDIKGQMANVLAQADRLLAQHNSDKTHILSCTIFVTDLNTKPAMNEAWKAYFAAEHLPARATIGISDLGPKVLLEMVMTAAVKA